MKNTFPTISIEEVQKILSITIKGDEANRLIIFLAMLTAYTDKDQLNIYLNAPSSSGKTYITKEIAKLFPGEDLIALNGATPTSFFYGDSKFDEKQNARIVDLERKILILYEQPDTTLQQRLRSLLSHDNKELEYRITNRTKNGANRCEKVILKGFPTTIFCSANTKMDEQEKTRSLLLSPEITEEKIRQSINRTIEEARNPGAYQKMVDNNPERQQLTNRIKAIKELKIKGILVPDDCDISYDFDKFAPHLKPRHSRDIGHILSIIAGIAMLNAWDRNYDEMEKYICATKDDKEEAFKLWASIHRTQDMGISPYVFNFFQEYIFPLTTPEKRYTNKAEIQKYYFTKTKSSIGSYQLKSSILEPLEMAGFICYDRDPIDNRKTTIRILRSI